MPSPRSAPIVPMAGPKDTVILQWQTAMERLKHFEVLVGTGLGLYLGALGYALSQVLVESHGVESHSPTEREYWFVVFILTVLCICQLHVTDCVSGAAAAVIKLEVASQGELTYLTEITSEITWTASLGFLTAYLAPAISVLSVVFEYRSLSSNRFAPIIVMVITGLVFLAFAVVVLRRQRIIIATVKPSLLKTKGGGGSKKS